MKTKNTSINMQENIKIYIKTYYEIHDFFLKNIFIYIFKVTIYVLIL